MSLLYFFIYNIFIALYLASIFESLFDTDLMRVIKTLVREIMLLWGTFAPCYSRRYSYITRIDYFTNISLYRIRREWYRSQWYSRKSTVARGSCHEVVNPPFISSLSLRRWNLLMASSDQLGVTIARRTIARSFAAARPRWVVKSCYRPWQRTLLR